MFVHGTRQCISIWRETIGTGSCLRDGGRRGGGAGWKQRAGLGIMTDVANLQVQEISTRVVLRRLY